MYLYKIGYYSCEESDYIELYHERKFSKEELENIIAEIVLETVKYIKSTDENYFLHNFQDVYMTNRFHELLKEIGFKEIKYDEVVSCFGWAGIFSMTGRYSWEYYRQEDNLLNKITKTLNNAGFTEKDDAMNQIENELE